MNLLKKEKEMFPTVKHRGGLIMGWVCYATMVQVGLNVFKA